MKRHEGKTFIEIEDDEEAVLVSSIPKENKFKVMLRGFDITSRVKGIISKQISEKDIAEHLDKIDTTEELQGQKGGVVIMDDDPIADELDEE